MHCIPFIHCLSVSTFVVPAPRIITHPIDTSAATPFGAEFTCSAQAYGTIVIVWQGKDNLPSPVQVSTPELTTSTLIIPNVTGNDVGTYCCVAWAGRLGTKSNEAKLILAGTVYYYGSMYICMLHVYAYLGVI